MAGNTFDPRDFPWEQKRKALKGHDERSLGSNDGSAARSDTARLPDDEVSAEQEQTVRRDVDIDTDQVVGADEWGLGYGPEEAEEDDRGLH